MIVYFIYFGPNVKTSTFMTQENLGWFDWITGFDKQLNTVDI